MDGQLGTGDHGGSVLNAARADMEFKTSLPALRHYLENLLAAFAHAVVSRDDQYLDGLMKGVTVRLEGCLACTGSRPGGAPIISWFSVGSVSRRQTVTNLSVHFEEGFVLYSAIYQDWETTPAPRCIAMGTYRGRLKPERQVWRWVEHSAQRISGCPQFCPDTAAAAAVRWNIARPGTDTYPASVP
ncbi:hypothetical protein PV772_11475 [Pseudarthrobacter sp. CC12]|uniref:hypothetical protein n=1 Tax=Pseudarthrobacter sp. CC12 TaxID=3029193 RepID=UPI003266189A